LYQARNCMERVLGGDLKHKTLGVSRGLVRVIVGDVLYYTVAKTWAIASSASLPSFSWT
jgi:hypothetical protein